MFKSNFSLLAGYATSCLSGELMTSFVVDACSEQSNRLGGVVSVSAGVAIGRSAGD